MDIDGYFYTPVYNTRCRTVIYAETGQKWVDGVTEGLPANQRAVSYRRNNRIGPSAASQSGNPFSIQKYNTEV